ncbi:MAG: glycosyltransferase family 2 protein [Lachnospiraceae bacterium]|nr:glycosyltransferase family 2 protein [Lachnospiraceae bacterium]
MTTKRVLVILINYNSTDHTVECLGSIFKNKTRDVDVIIIDNASILTEREKLRKIDTGECKIVYLDDNLGFSGGNNVGIKYALDNNYDGVLLLNNDTIVAGNFFWELNKSINEHKESILTFQIRNYYKSNEILYDGGKVVFWKGAVKILGVGKTATNEKKDKKITFAHGCCMYIPREIIINVGFMPEDYFLYFEDTAYSVEAIKKGYNIWYSNKTNIWHKECVSTGLFSNNYQYYFCRNRLLFTKKYVPWYLKPIAYTYTFAFAMRKIIERKFIVANCHEALRDFVKGKVGKK